MSNFPYKNPISPLQSIGSQTIDRNKTFGNSFSVLNTGGFMEVFNLSDLVYTIPVGQTGGIEFSGNVIPIQFKKGSGSVFSPDVLTLNSDNISSGRRRLGMLVYVYETDKIYQFNIDNYLSLWLAATGATGPGGNTVVISDFGTTVKNNTVEGQNFINAWSGSTIEGLDTGSTFSWSILKTGAGDIFLPLTGGTVSGDTIFLSGLSANTIYATNYLNLPSDFNTFVTGFTYSSNTFTIKDNSGSTFSATINSVTGLTVNGNIDVTGTANVDTISASTYQNLPVSGVTSGVGISALTNDGLVTITNTAPDQTVVITGGTNIQIVSNYPEFGVIYTGQTTFPYLPLSGGTVTGDTIFLSGLSANTIYATNYLNLPNDLNTFVTGFTFDPITYLLDLKQNTDNPSYSSFTANLAILASDVTITGGTYNATTGVATFTNNSGGTFDVSGFTTGMTDTIIIDFFYTSSANTFTINQSNGSGFTATFNTVSGLTVDGTISATTYLNVNAVTGGTYDNGTITLSGTGNVNGNVITGFTKYFISGSTPTGTIVSNGDRWYNTNNGIELVYINDGDSSQWVQPSNSPGPAGYSNLMITSGITTSAATLSINTNYYGVNYNGQVNLTLPNPSGYDGYNMTVKDEGGYSSTYRIRLTPVSGLIDGNTYVDMNLNYIALHLVARNNNWWVI